MAVASGEARKEAVAALLRELAAARSEAGP
jgi:hypothetical protein